MIEVDALEKRFAGVSALDRISFSVGPGEVWGLLGPNGAGKTTCMRILAGYLAPSGGSARVDGHDVAERNLSVRRRVGYLPEGAPLYHELRVEEQLLFAARLRGISRRARGKALDEVVERCALGEVRRRVIGQLSKGFRQRVGLAAALLGAPKLLILDEPTAGLDPNQIRDVRQLLRQLGGQQTVLLSSHILNEVEAICEKVLILDRGRVVAAGTVEEVCADDAAATIEVGGSADEAARILERVDGVEIVRRVASRENAARFELCGALGGETCARIARAIHDGGLDLRELRRERARLEQVFTRLTAHPSDDDSPSNGDGNVGDAHAEQGEASK